MEPSLTYVTGTSTGPNIDELRDREQRSEHPAGSGLAALANSGTCYLIRDVANLGGTHTQGTTFGSTTPANCTGGFARNNASLVDLVVQHGDRPQGRLDGRTR